MRDIVEFPMNTPVTLALKFAQGKLLDNERGKRMMYTTTDDRVIFLDLPVAAQITKLGVAAGELFTGTKRSDGKKGSTTWFEFARVIGEQPNGTFVAPKLPPATPKPMSSADASQPSGVPPWVTHLIKVTDGLTAAYAVALEHSNQAHGNKVKPEDIRNLLTTAYISLTKGGTSRAA